MAIEHMVAIIDAITCIGMSAYIAWQARIMRVDPVEKWVPLGLTFVYLFLTYLLWHGCQANNEVFPYPVVYMGLVPVTLGLLATYPMYVHGQWLWRGRFVEADRHYAKEQNRRDLQAARLQVLLEQTQNRLAQMRRMHNDDTAANSDAAALVQRSRDKKTSP